MTLTRRNRITAALLLAVIFIAGTWLLLTRTSHSSHAVGLKSAEKKVLYYQSPMHPWVKSDKPGRCTVCGMDLVPIYEGAQRVQATSDNVMLPPGAPNAASIRTVEVRR